MSSRATGPAEPATFPANGLGLLLSIVAVGLILGVAGHQNWFGIFHG